MMGRLLRLRMNIPGEYRDLWLYKSRLYVWDRVGSMSFLDLDVAARHLAVNYGSAVAVLAQTLIFRNDWKVGEQLRSMLGVQEIEEAFFRPFADRESVVVDLPEHLFSRSASDSYEGTVLDTCIYANRVYLGTPEGLLESYIDPRRPEHAYRLDQQTDFRVSKIAVRYAAVNASAEEKGLYFARIRFPSPADAPGFRRSDWKRVADYSLSTSHASHNLLNYTDASVPSLLRARVVEGPTHEKAWYEEYQVVGYEDPKDLSAVTYSALAASASASRSMPMKKKTTAGDLASQVEPVGDVQVLGNSSHHLLAAWDDRLRVVDIRAREGREIEARPSRSYSNTNIEAISPDSVLETYPIDGGFVVELPDSLHLIMKEGSFPFADGQVARVRTFVNSIRHKEVVATIEEDNASLTGFYLDKRHAGE